jgi:hypothetical protein
MKKILFVLLMTALSTGNLFAAGENSGISLGQNLFAGPAALGDAFTAAEGGLSSVSFNPAGFAGLTGSHNLSFCYSSELINTNLGFMGYGFKKGPDAFMIGVTYLNSGLELFSFSDGSSYEKVALQETTIHLGYARNLFDKLDLGVSLKNFSSSLVEQYSASTMVYDIGFIYKEFFKGFSAGASLLNFGGGLKYVNQQENLPQQARLGIMYAHAFTYRPEMSDEKEISVRAFLDSNQTLSQNSLLSAGIEGEFFNMFSVRCGNIFDSNFGGFSAGLGLRAQTGLTLDYSLGFRTDLDPIHKLSLNIDFN